MTKPPEESMQLWECLKKSIQKLAEDPECNANIRQMGFEVKNMYCQNGAIHFSVETTNPCTIPYSVLGLGLQGCLDYIDSMINAIEESYRLYNSPE